MQNAIWKLTALAGVLGVGFLGLMQVQQGLSRPDSGIESPAGTDDGLPTGTAAADADHEHEQGHQHELDHDAGGLNFEQDEPKPGVGEPQRLADDQTEGAAGIADVGNAGSSAASSSAFARDRHENLESDPFGTGPAAAGLSSADLEDAAATGSDRPGGASQTDPQADAGSFGTDAELADLAAENPFGDDSAGSAAASTGKTSKGEATSPEEALDGFDPFAGQATPPGSSDVERAGFDQSPPAASSSQAADLNSKGKTNESTTGPSPAAGGPQLFGPDASASARDREPPRFPSDPKQSPKPIDSAGDAADQDGGSSAEDEVSPGAAPTLEPVPEPLFSDRVEDDKTNGGRSPADDRGHEPSSDHIQSDPRGGEAGDDASELEAPTNLVPTPGPSPAVPSADSETDKVRGDGMVHDDSPRGPQQPQLNLQKVAPKSAVLGQPMVYEIFVKNVGTVAANQVVVEDQVPKGTQLGGTIPRAELAGKRLRWKIGTLQPGEMKRIAVKVVPMEEGQIGSVATVNFVAEIAAETQITAPKLLLDFEGPKQASLGEPVTFHFRVTNSGSGNADGVIIRDLVPPQLKHSGGNDLEYEVGTLPPGESREIKLSLTAAQMGSAVNHAIVTAAGGISVESKQPVEIVGARLSISRTGPERGFVGRSAVYTNIVKNDSDQPVRGATVVEIVPAGMKYVDATNRGQYDANQQAVVWQIDEIGPKESYVVKVKLAPNQPGTLDSTVKVMDGDGNQTEIRSSTSVEGYASVHVEIPPVDGPVAVDEQVAFRLIARNRGTNAAHNVRIQVTLPPELELVSARGPGQHAQSGERVMFSPIPEFAGSSQVPIDLVLRSREPGDVRVGVQIEADEMQKPLSSEAAVLIIGDGP